MRYAAEAPEGHHGLPLHGAFPVGLGTGLPALQSRHGAAVGLETHPLAQGPLWHRIGTLVGGSDRHGDNFYNFEGLRAKRSASKVQRPSGAEIPRRTPRTGLAQRAARYLGADRPGGLEMGLSQTGLLGRCKRIGRRASQLDACPDGVVPAPAMRFAPSSCRAACPFFTFFPAQTRNTSSSPPPGETWSANRRRPKATRGTEQQGSRPLTPAFAGATNRYRPPCPRWRHDHPPAMTKPSPRPRRFPQSERTDREGTLHQRQFLISVPCRRAARQRRHQSLAK